MNDLNIEKAKPSWNALIQEGGMEFIWQGTPVSYIDKHNSATLTSTTFQLVLPNKAAHNNIKFL